MFLKHKLLLEPRCDRVHVAREHLGGAAAVVEADERLGDDEAALRQLGPVGGELHRRLELRDVVVGEVADDRLAERLGLLEGDEPGARADEGVPPEPALLDRLEQEARRGALAQAEVGAERREQVCRDSHRHRLHARWPSRSSSTAAACARAFRTRATRLRCRPRCRRGRRRDRDGLGRQPGRAPQGRGAAAGALRAPGRDRRRRRAHRRRRPDRGAPARQLARERRLRPARRDPHEGRGRPAA